ncbi:MAG TPA: glycosyltransferase 87 family protein [Streptosporangiaceae bacterium]|nr:glycosyltransferase 87 family protein [Streptosporangiaceae bacterium]
MVPAVTGGVRGAAPGRTRARGPEPPRWRSWALAVLAWAAAAALAALLTRAAITHPPHMNDLSVYRTAGRQVLRGKFVYPSVPADQVGNLGRSYLVFTYPPFAAILAVPLALIPWHVARLGWVAMVYGPLAMIVFFAFRPLLARTTRYRAAAFGVIFAVSMFTWPMLQQIRFGQVDIALAALCVADIAADRPRWPRGLLIGLATAVKLTPAVFIVYLLVTGRRKAAAVSSAAAAACALVAWLAVPSDSSRYWTGALLDPARLGRPRQVSDQSVRAMLLRAVPAGHVPALLWIAVVLVVTVGGFAAARRAAAGGNDLAGVAIVGLTGVLVSPVSWIHHMVWVVPAIGALLGDGHRVWRWIAATGTAEFFVFFDPYSRMRPWFQAFAPDLVRHLVKDAYGLAAAAVILLLATVSESGRLAVPAKAGRDKPPPLRAGPGPDYSTAPDESG